jgi:hypothetical protein
MDSQAKKKLQSVLFLNFRSHTHTEREHACTTLRKEVKVHFHMHAKIVFSFWFCVGVQFASVVDESTLLVFCRFFLLNVIN